MSGRFDAMREKESRACSGNTLSIDSVDAYRSEEELFGERMNLMSGKGSERTCLISREVFVPRDPSRRRITHQASIQPKA
jgi:hypothetical protein